MPGQISRRDWINRSGIAALALGLNSSTLQAAQAQNDSVISSFEAVPVRIPLNEPVRRGHSAWIVKVHTTSGITGLAETRSDPREELERMSGRPVWSFLHRNLNGLECAIYDIAARAAGLPLARLLSSTARTLLPVGCRRSSMLRGLKADSERGMSQRVNVHVADIEKLRALDEIDLSGGQIVVDGRESLGGAAGALKSIENLRDKLPVAAVLDPLRQTDLIAYRELRKNLSERLVLRWNAARARNFLMEALSDAFIVSPFNLYSSDAGICELAGLGSWIEIPPNSGILSAYSLQQAAAVPSLELLILPDQNAQGVVANFPAISSGLIELPDRPGLGVELDEDAINQLRRS